MIIFDLHNDALTAGESIDFSKAQLKEYLLSTDKIASKVLAVWTSTLREPFEYVKNAIADAILLKQKYFAVEDLHFLTEDILDEFCSLPLAYCTLAWSGNNCLAGGHKDDGGLTLFGKRVIKKLNGSKIFIDVAHLNKRSFYDVLDCTDMILNSHTCLDFLHPHSRNIDKEQAKKLCGYGAITALTTVPSFMTDGNATRADFLLQLLSYADTFGVDTLAVGTDFYGTDPIEGLETYDKFDYLRNDLKNSGFSDENIDKIFFKNAQKFIKKTRAVI